MENWRDFVRDAEESELVDEGVAEYIPGSSAHKMRTALGREGPLDYIKAGFSKLIKAPEEFNQLIRDTEREFEIKLKEKLESLIQSEQMKEIGAEIADKIVQNTDSKTLAEGYTNSPDLKQFSLQDLARMGVGKETIELVAHTVSDNGAAALLEAAESVVKKTVPPKIKDWLLRFVSKFIGSFVFGFIDNFIMVLAGSQIDAQFGSVAGAMVGTSSAGILSAGLGNAVSDAIGELASNTIENTMHKAGLNPEAVTDDQVAVGPIWMRFLDKQAGVIGIVVGCLVGLFPLFLEERRRKSL